MLKINKSLNAGLLIAGLMLSTAVAAQAEIKKWYGYGGGYWIEVNRCALVDDVKFVKYDSLIPGDVRGDLYAAITKCVDVNDIKKKVRNPIQYPMVQTGIPSYTLEELKKGMLANNGYKKNDVVQMDIRIQGANEEQVKKILARKGKNEVYKEVSLRGYEYKGPLSQFK